MKTLKARLNKQLKNVYLLQGDDLFLFDKAFAMVKNACHISMEEFNLVKFDDDNFSCDRFLDATEVLPLIDQKRLILLKNITKVTTAELKKIGAGLEQMPKSTVVVIYDFENKFGLLKEQCEFVDCRRFDQKMAQAVLVNELAKRGKQITQEAVSALLEYCNGFLTKAINELDKLCFVDLENPLITKNMVEKCVSKENEFAVFELTQALGERNVDRAVQLASLLAKEQGIISLVANHFRRMFFISISQQSDQELAQSLGIKEYAVKKIRQQQQNFSKMQLKKIFNLLEEIDYKIKSGQMLSENAFNFLVMKILFI